MTHMRGLRTIRGIVVVFSFLSLILFGAVAGTYAQLPTRSQLPGNATPSIDPNITPTSQTPDVNVPTGTPQRVSNCDVCGYCEGSQPPPRWEACRNCVYREVGDVPATQNQTLLGIPTPNPNYYFTDLGCISTQPGEFTSQITRFFFQIVGGIAFLFFLYGTGIVATARSDPQRLNHGKRILIGSIMGLLVALFAIFIVQLIATVLGLPL